jgi:hypothetical protein
MNNETPENNKAINYEPLLYTVHVICWDGVEYERETTKDEINIVAYTFDYSCLLEEESK